MSKRNARHSFGVRHFSLISIELNWVEFVVTVFDSRCISLSPPCAFKDPAVLIDYGVWRNTHWATESRTVSPPNSFYLKFKSTKFRISEIRIQKSIPPIPWSSTKIGRGVRCHKEIVSLLFINTYIQKWLFRSIFPVTWPAFINSVIITDKKRWMLHSNEALTGLHCDISNTFTNWVGSIEIEGNENVIWILIRFDIVYIRSMTVDEVSTSEFKNVFVITLYCVVGQPSFSSSISIRFAHFRAKLPEQLPYSIDCSFLICSSLRFYFVVTLTTNTKLKTSADNIQ